MEGDDYSLRGTRPVPALKDASQQTLVPNDWRPVIVQVVDWIACGMVRCMDETVPVEPVGELLRDSIRKNIDAYGESLSTLPLEAWRTSVAQWMDGYWDVVVDLWTVESGRSDLVLDLSVFEQVGGYQFRLGGVYVP
jgi:hypothetical protein